MQSHYFNFTFFTFKKNQQFIGIAPSTLYTIESAKILVKNSK